MKIKKVNELIIDYRTQSIDEFYHRIKELLNEIPLPPRDMRHGMPRHMMMPGISLEDAADIGRECGIEVVDYQTFYNDLPQSDKKTAPTKNIPAAFALRNPVSGQPRVVLNANIDERLLDYIYHMLKHETIHVKQASKRPNYNKPLSDPNDSKKYFSDTDEIMAFSQSIVDELINMINVNNIRDAIAKLNKSRLYNDIKNNVDGYVLKKYHKYIYLYLEKELGEDKNEKTKKEMMKEYMSNFLKRDF